MKGRPGCHFSFSGLKTAVKHAWAGLAEAERTAQAAADLAASFQAAAGDVLVDRTAHALVEFARHGPRRRALVAAGGVAANACLRAASPNSPRRGAFACWCRRSGSAPTTAP